VTVPAATRPEPFPPVRRLGPADRRRCAALAVDRGWSPEQPKWSLLLAASEVFGVDAPDGRGLAGAVVLTRWAADYASVGMMLVAARYGRRGLGRALMEHLLRVAGDDATVTLFATDMGRPLYEKLGFRVVRRSVSFAGDFRPSPAAGSGKRAAVAAAGSVRFATEPDLPAILALDRAAFGADRGQILTRLPGFADRIAVYEPADAGRPGTGDGDQGGAAGGLAAAGRDPEGRRITGYAAAWRNNPASTVIGPLVAPDGEAARRLVTALAAGARTPVRLDLDPDREELPGWAHAHGLEPVGRTVVMARGERDARGYPDRLFTPISVALA
jgi:GNAT superfamily N-acetyltransferase